jgi:hypothetical protein
LLVDAQQRAQQFFGSLLASSGKRNLRRSRAKQASRVVGYIECHRLRRTGGWRSYGERVGCWRFQFSGLLPDLAKVDAHRYDQHQQRGYADQEMAGDHGWTP